MVSAFKGMVPFILRADAEITSRQVYGGARNGASAAYDVSQSSIRRIACANRLKSTFL